MRRFKSQTRKFSGIFFISGRQNKGIPTWVSLYFVMQVRTWRWALRKQSGGLFLANCVDETFSSATRPNRRGLSSLKMMVCYPLADSGLERRIKKKVLRDLFPAVGFDVTLSMYLTLLASWKCWRRCCNSCGSQKERHDFYRVFLFVFVSAGHNIVCEFTRNIIWLLGQHRLIKWTQNEVVFVQIYAIIQFQEMNIL